MGAADLTTYKWVVAGDRRTGNAGADSL